MGENSCGKSTALKLVGQLVGMRTVSQSSSESVISDLTKTTFPLGWDDPTFAHTVRSPLAAVFNGCGNQTQARGNEKPITAFILTCNFEMDGDMR